MNIQTYQALVKQKAEIDTVAEHYALQYRFLNRNFAAQHFSEVQMDETSVSIKWHWHGAYGAEEEGWINVPVAVLLGPKENWDTYIQSEIEREQKERETEEQAMAERRRQAEITVARAVLEREGLLPK